MTATQDEHTGLQAIEVASSVTINHHSLGQQFFEWDNTEQASFLHGAMIGYQGLRGAGGIQLLAIVDAAKAWGMIRGVRDFVDVLHEYISEDAK